MKPWQPAGLAVMLLAAVAVLLAAVWWPVADPRPLKMSCYWALRAVLAPQMVLGGVGWLIASSVDRGAVRALAPAAMLAAAAVPLCLHLLVPVMPHNLPRAQAQDALAALALVAAAVAWRQAAPETDLDAALDALAPAAEQPGS